MLLSHSMCSLPRFFLFSPCLDAFPVLDIPLADSSCVAFGLDYFSLWVTRTSIASTLCHLDLAILPGGQGCSCRLKVPCGQREPSVRIWSAINHHLINKDDVMILFTPWCCQTWGKSHQCRLPGRFSVFPASGWKPRGCQ